ERFQGVRVFDISDVLDPVQVATVQTCRGSHTHSILADPDDAENLYVYVSGTAGVRPPPPSRAATTTPRTARTRPAGASRSSRCRSPRPTRPRGSADRGCSPTRPPARSTGCRT